MAQQKSDEDKLGTKRICTECGARFYDLNKSPATCPKCGAQMIFEAPAQEEAAPETTAAPSTAEPEKDSDELSLEEMIEAEDEEANDEDDTLLPTEDDGSEYKRGESGAHTDDDEDGFGASSFLDEADDAETEDDEDEDGEGDNTEEDEGDESY